MAKLCANCLDAEVSLKFSPFCSQWCADRDALDRRELAAQGLKHLTPPEPREVEPSLIVDPYGEVYE